MLVHRILDAFFRTLDAVDAARDRVDRLLGREPRPDPWAVEWPPPAQSSGEGATQDAEASKPASESVTASAETLSAVPAEAAETKAPAASAAKASTERVKKATKKANKAASASTAGKKKSAATRKKAAPKTASKKASSSKRKGSVDRQGKDFDSPRARAVSEFVREHQFGVVSPQADHNGKKVLARVLWALHAAEEAGSEKGLTSADASALLHLAANIEVFATNLARACRDHTDLIVETEMDGRSKRYKLTAAGKDAAREVLQA